MSAVTRDTTRLVAFSDGVFAMDWWRPVAWELVQPSGKRSESRSRKEDQPLSVWS
jgi:hypothetical protein